MRGNFPLGWSKLHSACPQNHFSECFHQNVTTLKKKFSGLLAKDFRISRVSIMVVKNAFYVSEGNFEQMFFLNHPVVLATIDKSMKVYILRYLFCYRNPIIWKKMKQMLDSDLFDLKKRSESSKKMII